MDMETKTKTQSARGHLAHEPPRKGQGRRSQSCRVLGRSNNNANANGGLAYSNANNASSNSNTNNGSRLANNESNNNRPSITASRVGATTRARDLRLSNSGDTKRRKAEK